MWYSNTSPPTASSSTTPPMTSSHTWKKASATPQSAAAAATATGPPTDYGDLMAALAIEPIDAAAQREAVHGMTGMVRSQAELPNGDQAIKPGQFVRVRLVGATRPDVVQVPQRAVMTSSVGS